MIDLIPAHIKGNREIVETYNLARVVIEEENEVLRVVTFNIRYGTAQDGSNSWKHRKEILFRCIGKIRPDILALQECLPCQSDEIKERFPGWDRFGLGRYHNTYTGRQHELFSGEHCTIFYDCEKLRLKQCGTFWLSDTPAIPGSTSWGNNLPRNVTWGIIRQRGNGGTFSVFNTHYDSGENLEFGKRSSQLIREKISEISTAFPSILVGDFNRPPGCKEHAFFKEFFCDVWEVLQKPEPGSGTSHSFSGKPENRIDWILVSPEVKVLSVEKVTYNQDNRFPSDHFPILAELKIKQTI